MTELWTLSATDLAARVRGRSVSAREAALASLARLDAVNPAINAVVAHRPEAVLAEADAIDALVARGGDPGKLAGVPVTIKVNADMAGYATTNGLQAQRDLIATQDSPVVDNLRRAGAVILGRTNAPAFSVRWFTGNALHGRTRNPRDRALTPGGSSGGAAAGVAAGIGHLAHGTDIGGSIRYPAYACGIHGLRPTLGRVAAWNASGPDRAIGAQLMAVSGPIGRTIADLRAGLHAMAAPDPRDPWWVPAPLEGPPRDSVATICLRPGGLRIVPEVEAALLDAGRRLETAGWRVDMIEELPSLHEATALQIQLWLGDGYDALLQAAEREGDTGALACIRPFAKVAGAMSPDALGKALVRRVALTREWLLFLERHPVVLMPVSAELPFEDDADIQDFDRVWAAQLTQTGLPLMGLPGLVVSTGLVGRAPVGVQLVAGRYREDLLLLAGEAIEAGGVPPSPIDPV